MGDAPGHSTWIFTYGTLMPGQGNHRWIERFVQKACRGRIAGVLVNLGSFPALIPGDGIVEGVCLEIDHAALAVADRIEGYGPSQDHCLYVRKEVVVMLTGGQEVKAWTYEYARPQHLRDYPQVAHAIVDGNAVYAWPPGR